MFSYQSKLPWLPCCAGWRTLSRTPQRSSLLMVLFLHDAATRAVYIYIYSQFCLRASPSKTFLPLETVVKLPWTILIKIGTCSSTTADPKIGLKVYYDLLTHVFCLPIWFFINLDIVPVDVSQIVEASLRCGATIMVLPDISAKKTTFDGMDRNGRNHDESIRSPCQEISWLVHIPILGDILFCYYYYHCYY